MGSVAGEQYHGYALNAVDAKLRVSVPPKFRAIVADRSPERELIIGPSEYDFGERDPRLDVARFLRMAHDVGLRCLLRPGPHINAELTFFGLPERIVWDPECQARTPGGHPVMLPMVPVAFPVPSYASDAFLEETARWYRVVGQRLASLCWPDGPIVLVQVDNEGALYFRDGQYDQDYHPDAIVRYRAFLRAKYGSLDALAAAYGSAEGDAASRFATFWPLAEAGSSMGPFI